MAMFIVTIYTVCHVTCHHVEFEKGPWCHFKLRKAQVVLNLRKADVAVSNLRKAHIAKSNLRKANIAMSNFRKAQIAMSNFRKAYVAMLNLRNTYVAMLNLRKSPCRSVKCDGPDPFKCPPGMTTRGNVRPLMGVPNVR